MNSTKTLFAIAALQATAESLRLQKLMESHQLAQTEGPFDWLTDVGNALNDAVDTVGDAFTDFGNGVVDAANSIATEFTDLGISIDTAFTDLGNGIVGYYNTAGEWVTTSVETLESINLRSPVQIQFA